MVNNRVLLGNEASHLFLSKVAEDFGRYGTTNQTCPVCGGHFVFRKVGNSYEVRCETDDCMKLTSRGI